MLSAELAADRYPERSVMSMEVSPSDPVSPQCEVAMAFAASLVKSYAKHGGNVTDLFAAFVGLVVDRDGSVGNDCIIALDRWISDASAGRRGPSA